MVQSLPIDTGDHMTPIRHILMHVDSSERVLNQLALCRSLSARFGAKVTAMYAVTPWLLRYPVYAEGLGAVAAQLSEWDVERLKTTEARITAAIAADKSIQWSKLESDSPFDFAKEAVYADLLVLGQRDPDDPAKDDVPSDFAPHAIVHSGRPALVLPPGEGDVNPPKIILVAWNGSRESAAALTAALPFLYGAKEVHVAHCSSDAADEGGFSKLTYYLRLHGVEPLFHSLPSAGRDSGVALLDQAREVKADLLVMGCYGHSRAREWVLGGTTRTVLANATLPVLMAH